MSIQEICTCECLPLPLKTTVNKIVNCANMKPLITSLICCFPLLRKIHFFLMVVRIDGYLWQSVHILYTLMDSLILLIAT